MKHFIIYILLILSSSTISQTLVGYWPFTGNPADSSGNGNHGNLVNNPVPAKDRYGVSNRSYQFNGTNSYIIGTTPGTNFPVGSSPRTITAWIKSNYLLVVPTTDRNIFHYGTVGSGVSQNFHLFLNPPGKAALGNGYGYGTIIAPDSLGDTTWHFVAGVYEGPGTNILSIYIDGRLRSFGPAPTVPNTGTGSPWKMGMFMDLGQPAFSGRIDDVRIFNGAMNAAQILNLYIQTTTAPNLVSPINGSNGISLTPVLDWDSLIVSTSYRVQIAIDSLLYNRIWDSSGIERSQAVVPVGRLSNNVRYYWRVRNTINGETGPWSHTWSFTTALVGLQIYCNDSPDDFVLSQNFPNPFNPVTKIKFALPPSPSKEGLVVSLIIYDILGQEIATLVNEQLKPETYEAEWDAKDYPSGIYFYKLLAGEFIETKKMVLIK